MKTKLYITLLASFLVFTFSSCDHGKKPQYAPTGPFTNGAYISNEGTYGQANASVSFYDFAADTVRNSIFTLVNNRPLGQLLQSTCIANGKAYMMLNMSDTVMVASADNFVAADTITGCKSPRYMTSFNMKGYISQWGENGVVKVIDLVSNKILQTIKVGMGPEQLLAAGGKILVCNGGAYDVDSTISVINPISDIVEKTVIVGDNPKELVADKHGDIWVICYGYIKYDLNFNIVLETPSKLVRLSGTTFQKTGEYIISQTKHPQHIGISKDKSTVYYGGGFGYPGIYAMSITSSALPTVPLIGEKLFYGFNVNPGNGEIFALDAGNFTDGGTMYRYSSTGTFLKQYAVGIAPNGVTFR